MGIREDRIAKGQCPNDGKEAAPYRLCFDCRQQLRINRSLNRGARLGALTVLGTGAAALFSINKNASEGANRQWGKWSTKVILPENDGRGKPRLRGQRVDVEATLIKVIEFIGRPCTIDEISEAWGRLRSKRTSPLASDLACIIRAADKRKRRAAKLAAIVERQDQAAE